jgi:hypothetical protein
MIELTEIQDQLSKLVDKTPAPGKHAARNAISDIDNACEIRTIDPEISAFRAITGVEESARAILYAMKRRNRKGVEKRGHGSHLHKAAVYPFVVSFLEYCSLLLRWV